MMRQARQRIVVADHRKVGVAGAALIWPINDVDILITDKATPEEAFALLQNRPSAHYKLDSFPGNPKVYRS